MKLSQNFTLAEMTKSATADRLGLHNDPSPEIIAALELVAKEILQPVRNHFDVPFTPTSGYRSLRLNRALGSKDTSQHIKGQAVDIKVPGVFNLDLAKWIIENCKYDQMILEFYKKDQPDNGWVHVSVIKEGNRGESLMFDGVKYTPFNG